MIPISPQQLQCFLEWEGLELGGGTVARVLFGVVLSSGSCSASKREGQSSRLSEWQWYVALGLVPSLISM